MKKYQALPRVAISNRKWPDNTITREPIWCSVDLRDGNQALAIPMNVEKKLEMFQLLVDIGFKEIEVGFPSASKIEFDFIRQLVDRKMIPDDVTIQVLTQAREHLIRKTFEALKGTKQAIVHLYNSTSPLQRKITFNMNKEQIKNLAIEGTQLVKKLVMTIPETHIRLEYSPESFSDTETDYALEVCEAVMDVWEPKEQNKIILNLPETVEWGPPNIHADQVEWFATHLKERDKAIISLHTHNDRGSGIAASELGLMAGADRVEGTLFGNGERTGNLDVITLALNLFSDGVDISLDFHDLPRIRQSFERCTGMYVPPRHPYAGDLVFTAFSGSHQDAIKKGMDRRGSNPSDDSLWEVPYLPIDPRDIGRDYEAIIRINSQSGKGGVAYILSQNFGIEIPKKMQPDIGEIVNRYSDELGRELESEEVHQLFLKNYIVEDADLSLKSFITQTINRTIQCQAEIEYKGKIMTVKGEGKGPIDSFVHALGNANLKDFKIIDFHEQSLGTGSDTEALAYMELQTSKGHVWGVGIDSDISMAGLKALISAINRMN
ncbi:MAG: 2-isopropylmalate synthase [Spirochaetales bacterium]|nr:2-isopropylmalate synthase [Spirochaetales bacterium]